MFPVPFNEQKRLEALESFRIIDTPPEGAFDDLTARACDEFSVPIALVSLIDSGRQWFKSHAGLDVAETPRELAFCAHAILISEPLIVLDATQDSRFCNNPLVIDEPHVRFYAGAPLITSGGFRLGTFCVIDSRPRSVFSAEEIESLMGYARATMETLEKRRTRIGEATEISEAELTKNARQNLFALVANEIHWPISTLARLTSVIDELGQAGTPDPQYEKLLSDLDEIAGQIGQITDRMLDFARLGAGEIDLVEEVVDLGEFMEFARSAAVGEVGTDGIAIDIEPFDGSVDLRIDKTLSAQMVINLISNVVMSGPVGERVVVCAEVTSLGELDIRIEGAGVDPDDDAIERIVDKDGIVGPAMDADPDWMSSGLTLVRRLIELHGGRFLLGTAPSSGIAATLRFPAYRVVARSDAIAG